MTDFFSSFDRIYIVSLPYRLDRRRETDQQLQRFGLGLQHPRVTVFDAIRPADAGEFPSIGAHGCFLSHLEVLRTARAAGHERILIFEDDIHLVADLAVHTAQMQPTLGREDWWMFYGAYDGAPGPESPAGGMVRLRPDADIVTSSFIAYRREAIGPLIKHLEVILTRRAGDPAGGPMEFDGALNWFRRAHPEAPVWLAVPALGWQRSSRTDVHELRWFDRVPLVRDMVAWARSQGLVGQLRRLG